MNTDIKKKDLIKFEKDLFKFFNFNITMPTLYTFIDYYSNILKLDDNKIKLINNILYEFILLNIPYDIYSELSLYIIYYTLNRYKGINIDIFNKELNDNNMYINSEIDILKKYIIIFGMI